MATSRAPERRRPAPRPAAGDAAVCAIVLALAGTTLTAGLHHAVTDSAAPWPALLLAAAALATSAYPAMRATTPRASLLAVVAVQTFLPSWLQLTVTDIPAAPADGHPRLPAGWHHDPLTMAVLNLLAGLALALLLRSSASLPVRLSCASTSTAHRWCTRLLDVISLVLRRADEPLPSPRPRPRSAFVLPKPHALKVLLHRAQPCAP